MDAYARSWYEMAFERDFVVKRGAEFQGMFVRIMGLAHPEDFVAVRPWGRMGDQKNDGYLRTERRIFQVYAPEEMERGNTERKMQEDFDGALGHWEEHFDKWTFVHNSLDGIPPFVLRKILELGKVHVQIAFGQWSFPEIRARLFTLADPDVAAVLGYAPNAQAMLEVRFEDFKHVLRHLNATAAPADADLRPVPSDKLEANALSEDVEAFLTLGMRKARLVERFFARYHDPNYGDAVAAAFKAEYQALRNRGLSPDEIFWELEKFAGGGAAASHRERAAVLAVLAYLFESCDIYERARSIEPEPMPVLGEGVSA